MSHLIFFGYTVLAAGLFAQIEIQVEGPYGWAERLPTWRVSNAWTRRFFGDKPLTGYHLWVLLFSLLMAHLPFAGGWSVWTVRGEARSVAFLIFFWVFEDFLWFIFNPAFGLRGFRKDRIWWHKSAWWLIAPRDYWVFTPLGIIAYVCSAPR